MAKTTEKIKYVKFTYKKNGQTVTINEKVAKIFKDRGLGKIGEPAPIEDEKDKKNNGSDVKTKEQKYELLKDSGVAGLKPIAEMDEKILDEMIKELKL